MKQKSYTTMIKPRINIRFQGGFNMCSTMKRLLENCNKTKIIVAIANKNLDSLKRPSLNTATSSDLYKNMLNCSKKKS